ncbi:MAG TPA: energy transducer TonB [Candidatus Xenobia bacterium]|nr:energy transducer TonB [Candidatus Xenobia bacterium]
MTPSTPPRTGSLALGSSLPILLEYRNGRRWRITAGFVIEGLLVGLILTVPLLFPESFTPTAQLGQVSPPIWRGDLHGNPNTDNLGSGAPSRPSRPDRDDGFTMPVRVPDNIPDGSSVADAPDISGSGNGQQRLGDPTGPEFGRPPDSPIQVTPPNVPPPHDGVVDIRRYNLQPPRLRQRVEPVYPRLAIAAHIEGDVVLTAIIDTDGRVRQLTVKSGHPQLAQAARDAVAQWLYEPTTLNGQPVAVQLDVTVKFRLNR